MNKHLLFIYWTISMPFNLAASFGCMDNSYYLSQPYDNKEYHYVPCNCACKTKLSGNRNQCLDCRHYHKAQPLTIVPVNQELARRSARPALKPYSISQASAMLVRRYRAQQAEKSQPQKTLRATAKR